MKEREERERERERAQKQGGGEKKRKKWLALEFVEKKKGKRVPGFFSSLLRLRFAFTVRVVTTRLALQSSRTANQTSSPLPQSEKIKQ